MPIDAADLVGVLRETRTRTCLGIPTDAAFLQPTDGQAVLQTGPSVGFGLSDPPCLWIRVGGVWQPFASGSIQASITAAVNITAVTEGTADVVVTAGTIACDGVTGIEARFQAWSCRPDNTVAGRQLVLVLYEDGASIGQLARFITPAAAGDDKPVDIARTFVPTAGSHTYGIRGFVTAGTGVVSAGAGGSGAAMPAKLTIRRSQ